MGKPRAFNRKKLGAWFTRYTVIQCSVSYRKHIFAKRN